MNIQDLEKREDLQLLTDTQDVKALFEHLGKPELYEDYQGAFIRLGEGDYEEVYVFEGTIPYHHKIIERVL